MILVLIILFPIAGAAASLLPVRAHVARVATVGAAIGSLASSLVLASRVASGHPAVFIPGYLAADGLSALILVLQGALALTAALYSVGDAPHESAGDALRERRYHLNLNLFVASLFLVPVLLQPALTWVAVELTTLSSVFLVAHRRSPGAVEAAWKYAMLTILGATVALLGIFLLLNVLGTGPGALIQTWQHLTVVAGSAPPALMKLAFVLLLVGLGTKVGIFPVHTWLPDAHSQAPSPVCALLSGIEVSTILYVIVRTLPIFGQVHGLALDEWLIITGLASVAAAAFLILQVHDFKRMLAYSTMEHMGIILVALGFGREGIYAGLYQITTHAFAKSFAFYAAGAVVLIYGTRAIPAVRALIRTSPLAGGALFAAALAIAGSPPFAVFLSELSIMRAGIASGHLWAVVLLALFVAMAFIGVMTHVGHMVFGEVDAGRSAMALPTGMTAALVLAFIPVLVLGLYQPPFLHHLLTLATKAVSR